MKKPEGPPLQPYRRPDGCMLCALVLVLIAIGWMIWGVVLIVRGVLRVLGM